ncbi:MAG TPA: aspartate-semialdehyde dehydrogenase [Acidobacteriota bacterium]|nr:aspartate-semialdehyde dehydrogenase [Acidobacteriota bacterium]
MSEKTPVAVLGATGAVGQKFIKLLEHHPWFEVTEVAASERSAGRRYEDAVSWKQTTPIPASVRALEIQPCTPELRCRIAFSGLDASVAGPIEDDLVRAGYFVLSNSKNHRLDPDVPLVIPEVNADHLALIQVQRRNRNSKGFIVTNSNCSTMFLAMALGPLHKEFKVEKVLVATMQAVSGAGYPGVPSLDILGNVIPYIGGEEEKMEIETRKILGRFIGNSVELADFSVSAQCNRVAVEDGHTESVSVKLGRSTTADEIAALMDSFSGPPQQLRLPSAPERPILVMKSQDRPQPRFDVNISNGMATLVGRIRPCSVLDFKFTLLGHNTVRGAAGASILNAELLKAQGFLD